MSSPGEMALRIAQAVECRRKTREDVLNMFHPEDQATEGPREDTLCSRCASLDIDYLVSSRDEDTGWIMDVGKLGPEMEVSPCSMCRLFQAVSGQQHQKSEQTEYALYGMRRTHPFAFQESKIILVVFPVDLKWETKNEDRTILHRQEHGFITAVAASKDGTELLRGRRIRTDAIDFDIPRRWIDSCANQRGVPCNHIKARATWPVGLKLIDCEQGRIVQAPSYQKYSALSYVWGTNRTESSDPPIHLVHENGDPPVDDMLPPFLPPVMEDAFRVNAELGIRYIWIDRYCIDQDTNVNEKDEQIRQMDLVYQNAHVTFIAAAGSSPWLGLPGVSQACRRDAQPNAWIGGHHLVSSCSDPRILIKNSKWMKRAWTLQESFFSHRRLIFTHQQLYYECCGYIAQETIDHEGVIEGRLFKNQANRILYPDEIRNLLKSYSGRELSFQEDAIRAFGGVFHKFATDFGQVEHYYGLPLVPSLCPFERRYRLLPNRTETFLIALCWRNMSSGPRRRQFPSWSWAGWHLHLEDWGPVHIDLKVEGKSPRVFIENHDGALLDFEDYRDPAQGQRVPPSLFVYLDLWTIPLDLQDWPITGDWVKNWFKGRLDDHNFPLNISGHFAVFQDEKTTVQIPIYSLEHPSLISQDKRTFGPGFDQGEALGLLFGPCNGERFPETDFIMIVQDRGGHFERTGHMLFDRKMLMVITENPADPPDLDRNLRLSQELCFRHKKIQTVRIG